MLRKPGYSLLGCLDEKPAQACSPIHSASPLKCDPSSTASGKHGLMVAMVFIVSVIFMVRSFIDYFQ